MRSRILTVIGASVLALAIGVAFSSGASAGKGPGASGSSTALGPHAKTAGACYAQPDNDNPVGIVSQNFEPSFDAYDAQGADNFKLKTTCRLKTTLALGTHFSGTGPSDSYNVTFYKGGASPGAVVKDFQNASFTDTGFGSPEIRTKGKLKKGRYWVSVQANLDFGAGGEWGWMTNNTIRGLGAMWQNPGDGFGTGCTSWQDMVFCLGVLGQGGDFAFQLN